MQIVDERRLPLKPCTKGQKRGRVGTPGSSRERVRAVGYLFASEREYGRALTCFGVRLLRETAFGTEVTEFLGQLRWGPRQGWPSRQLPR